MRRFVGFPFDPFRWLALAVHLGSPHERSVRRHCGVPKVVVLNGKSSPQMVGPVHCCGFGNDVKTVASTTSECIVSITTRDQFQRVLRGRALRRSLCVVIVLSQSRETVAG